MKTLLLILLLHANASGQVIISEVLYNEPQSRTSLEWVEIYNQADTAVDLANYNLIANADTSYFEPGSIVSSGAYAVLARALVSLHGSDFFEGRWGDSSGYWGDSPQENYPAFDADFSLPNDQGYVMILIPLGQWSIYEYNQACLDGFSMERDSVDPPSYSWHQCTAPEGSTPGARNSVPLPPSQGNRFDVSPRLISPGGSFEIEYALPSAAQISIEVFNDGGLRQKILLANSYSSQGEITWDGTGSGGQKLLPGVYLVMFFVSGSVNEAKTIPVVIAP